MGQRPLVENIEAYAQDIVDTVREPLLILDATLRVQSANRAFYQTFHVSSEETEGRLSYELGNGQWDIQFGAAGLLEAIGRRRSDPLEEGVDGLLGEIARWHGSEWHQDDISILAVEVSVAPGRGEPGAERV